MKKKKKKKKAMKSTLGKSNQAVSNFFALIPTRSNYHMSAIFSGVGFQTTVGKLRKEKKYIQFSCFHVIHKR